jgi:hypothetical protein
MGKTTPAQRSLAWLRAEGYTAVVCERWNPHARVRQDLFGFADLMAVRADVPGVLAVQTTTTAHQADRLAKALALPALKVFLEAGNRLEIHGWLKRKTTRRWELTRRAASLDDLTITAGVASREPDEGVAG